MSTKFALVPVTLLAALALGACNATLARIDDNKELFDSYPAEVQSAIKSNRIERGFDHTQVFLALGEADRTESTEAGESWSYHATETRSVREEKSATEYRDELEAYDKAAQRGQAAQKPLTYRDVTQSRTRVRRIVHFVDGHVTDWEQPTEQWLDDWHS